MKLGVSEKRFLGWEPRQIHTYTYDESGRLTSTVVETEPEWDDAEREKMLALAEFEASVCKCGYPRDQVTDPTFVFQPETFDCPVCAATAVENRRLHDLDESARKAAGGKLAALPSDGRHLLMRLVGRKSRED